MEEEIFTMRKWFNAVIALPFEAKWYELILVPPVLAFILPFCIGGSIREYLKNDHENSKAN